LICVFVLAFLFLALLWRVPYGYDWTDEQYYSVVAYRILQGDRPLIDTWEVHQFSGILAAPVIGAFRLLNGGSMDGSILFLRYFYVSFQFAVSLLVFFTIKHKSGPYTALIAAGMTLAYTHFAINSYYYDSMTCLYTIASVMFAILFLEQANRNSIYAFFSGVCFALAVAAFPYTILTVPVYLIAWIVYIKTKNGGVKRPFGLLCFLAGGALIAGILIAFVLSRATLAEVAAGIKHMFSDPDHQSVNAIETIGQYLNTIRVVYAPYSYGAAILVLYGFAVGYVRNAERKNMLRQIGVAGTIIMIAAISIHALRYDWPGYHRINMYAMGMALVAPGLFLLFDRAKNRATFLFFAACFLSIAAQLGSNTRYYASSGMLLPASMATVVYLLDEMKHIQLKTSETTDENRMNTSHRVERFIKYGAGMICALVVLGLFTLRITAVYRDSSISELSAEIKTGAAQGISTTPENVAIHDKIVTDIRENIPSNGTILFTYLFPEGYLISDLKAATPSAYNMSMNSQWLSTYYESNADRIPTVIIALNPDLQYNNNSMNGAEEFLSKYHYKETQFAYFTMFSVQP